MIHFLLFFLHIFSCYFLSHKNKIWFSFYERKKKQKKQQKNKRTNIETMKIKFFCTRFSWFQLLKVPHKKNLHKTPFKNLFLLSENMNRFKLDHGWRTKRKKTRQLFHCSVMVLLRSLITSITCYHINCNDDLKTAGNRMRQL